MDFQTHQLHIGNFLPSASENVGLPLYSTYVRVYLGYLSDTLHKMPEDVSWGGLRDFT